MQTRIVQLIVSIVIVIGVLAIAGPAPQPASGKPDKAPSVEALIAGLEARLAVEPEDAKGWILLARSHDHLGNNDKAWHAYARARELGTTDDSLEFKLAANLVGELEK